MSMGTLTPASIPLEITAVCRRLRDAGFLAFLVGGAVRDHLRLPVGEASAKDFDITTSALPQQVIDLFGKRHTVPTGIQHGTITVLVDRKGQPHGRREHVEVTTFRGEGAYTDGRRPDQVSFIDDLTEDLRRRDFTINAMAYDPIDDRLADPFGGRADLAARVIRAVGDATARFSEDGLRTMRALRFAAQLGFALEPATEAAIPQALPTFRRVSGERVRDELLKLLGAPHAAQGLVLLQRTGLLAEILPELRGLLDDRAAAEDAARGDVALVQRLGHAVSLLPRDPVLRLGALLAPLAPHLWSEVAPRVVAVEVAWDALLQRLKLSAKEQARLRLLLTSAPPAYAALWTDAQVRRYLAATPPGLREDQALLRAALAEAHGQGAAFTAGAGALVARTTAELARGPALSIGELALTGKELIEQLGLPPGPRIGELLRLLLDRVLEDPTQNQKPHLLRLAREAP